MDTAQQPDTGGYVLYGGGVTRSLGPQMVLEEAGLPYTLVEMDERRGDHRQPAYLALNPAGFMPALVTPDGTVLHEAAAIMIFLAETHGCDGLLPPPGDPLRGLFFCRLFYQTNDLQPAIRRFFKPVQYSTDPTHADGIRNRARETALDRWSVYDRFLQENGPYTLGDRFSLADLHLTLWAAYGLDRPTDITDRFAAIRRCFNLTSARPKIASLIEKLQADMAGWTDT
ncbi:MAG: glutathione S-transferase family protein [Alphaproteobacteria bacterium]